METYNKQAGDPEVEAIVRSSLATLVARPDVDSRNIGLGRGCTVYGFPYNQGFTNNTTPLHILEN